MEKMDKLDDIQQRLRDLPYEKGPLLVEFNKLLAELEHHLIEERLKKMEILENWKKKSEEL